MNVHQSMSLRAVLIMLIKVDSVYKEFSQVEEGCLQLIFQVPSFVQQEIVPLSSEQERALAAEDVIRLTRGDYQFASKVCGYCVVTSFSVVPYET